MRERKEPRLGSIGEVAPPDGIPVLTERADPEAEAAPFYEADIEALADRVLDQVAPALREAIAKAVAELVAERQASRY